MSKIAVYTCITGGLEPLILDQNFRGADYYLYSDERPVTLGQWKYRKSTDLFHDPRRNARYHKLLSHLMFPDYDYTVWIDGSMQLKITAQKLVDELGSKDIMAFKHTDRSCVYEEGKVCREYKLDYADTIDKHLERLAEDGYPKDNGLSETKIVVRKNNDKVCKFNELWFYMLATGSLRCQLSFDYAVWKTKAKLKRLTSYKDLPEWFTYTKHVRRTYEKT